ncbi:MAG TPA: hypothetical protein VGK17_05270 [Propionicimonas sp.]|jgi:hypothetical protein
MEWLERHREADGVGALTADELIARVLAAGGRLEVEGDFEVKLAYTDLVRETHRAPSRPRGWRLEVKDPVPWSEHRFEVVTVRYFDDLVEEAPIPVPARVTRYHPAVKAYVDDRDWHLVTREHVARAARILQAVAEEAPRRAIEVVGAGHDGRQRAASRGHQRDREANHAHLVLRTTAGDYQVRVREQPAKGAKRQTPSYGWRDARPQRPRWLEVRQNEFMSTGLLELVVEGPGLAYDGYRIGDSSTMTVEERLPRLFRKLEIARLEHEVAAQDREREAGDRRRRWEAAMAEARDRYDERARWDSFVQLSREWDEVQRHREFLAAARAAVAAVDGPAQVDLGSHLAFVELKLAALDPLADVDRLLPEVSDPKPEDLKPFLGGWSPDGPDQTW